MAVEQRFDNGLLLKYGQGDDAVIFGLHDNGEWFSVLGEAVRSFVFIAVPFGTSWIHPSLADVWRERDLQATFGFASSRAVRFEGSMETLDGGRFKLADSIGRVLILQKGRRNAWSFAGTVTLHDALPENSEGDE